MAADPEASYLASRFACIRADDGAGAARRVQILTHIVQVKLVVVRQVGLSVFAAVPVKMVLTPACSA